MPKLFELNDIGEENADQSKLNFVRSEKDAPADDFSSIVIDGPAQYVSMMSRGKISLHQVIEKIVLKHKPCKVWLTSWAISENPIRSIVNLVQSGAIQELSCIFNYRVGVECPKAYQLAKFNFKNIKLSKIHAKVVIIETELGAITIITSANLTTNPRIEAYSITNDPQCKDFHLNWIKEVMNEVE